MFGRKKQYRVTDKFNLLVIDFPYFTKALDDDGYRTRCGFFLAKRKSAYQDGWTIERQFYTSTNHGDSIGGGDFVYPPNKTVSTLEELMKEFRLFEFQCKQDGMKSHKRDESSYTYGTPVDNALKILGCDKNGLPKKRLS